MLLVLWMKNKLPGSMQKGRRKSDAESCIHVAVLCILDFRPKGVLNIKTCVGGRVLSLHYHGE